MHWLPQLPLLLPLSVKRGVWLFMGPLLAIAASLRTRISTVIHQRCVPFTCLEYLLLIFKPAYTAPGSVRGNIHSLERNGILYSLGLRWRAVDLADELHIRERDYHREL